MNVHFVLHEVFERPGAYEAWVRARGHEASNTRVYEGDRLPETADRIALLVVMGGPQSPAATREECPHFDAVAEQSIISKCVAGGKAVVGVCLGAQLVGEALGAAFSPSPETEIGRFPISLTEAGSAHPNFSHFGSALPVGHWHHDMPGLTPDATIIATSAGCPRQIVAYGELVYGFQCHMEFTPDVVELLVAASGQELAWSKDRHFVQQPDVLLAQDWTAMNETLFEFLDKLAAAYEARQVVRTEAA
ncbi:MAG TPA: glutamine amidotransferase [Allosphingosinicella sp.]|nr:glutamine amidotransferase [Allosphingosinicella sp.]